MNRIKNILVFLFVLIFVHCAPKKLSYNPVRVKLVLPESYTTINARSIIDSIDYIFLETNDSCYISIVSEIFKINDDYVIFDQTLNRFIWFSKNGIFKKAFPNKFSDPDLDIHSPFVIDNIIYFYDLISRKIFTINKNNILSEQTPINPYFFKFYQINCNTYCLCYPVVNLEFNDGYFLRFIDNNGTEIKKSIKSKNYNVTNSTPRSYFYYIRNSIFFYCSELLSIFFINNSDVTQVLSFDLGELKTGNPRVLRCIEICNFIFVDLLFNRKLYNLIYDRSDSRLKLIKPIENSLSHIWGIPDNINYVYPIWINSIINDKMGCQVVSAKQLIDYTTQSKSSTIKSAKSVLDKIVKLKAFDNPVVIIHYFKNN